MGERVAKSRIKKEAGYLYYVKSNKEDGCLEIWKALLERGGRKKKENKIKLIGV